MLEENEVLGVRVQLFTIETLNALVQQKVLARERTVIANHNLHSIYLFHQNESFKDFFKLADYTHIDGMPLVYWSKVIGQNASKNNRITYVDWIHPLLHLANRNKFRVFYLGGNPGVAQAAIAKLKVKYSNVEFGECHGYFEMNNVDKNNAVLKDIHSFNPDILMVGMSMPRQEIWIKKNFEALPNCVILPCGACFDYIAGHVKTPPRFLGRIGLEWLYRFFQEPKRLFSRYFIEPLFLLPIFFKDLKIRLLKNKQL